MTRKTSFIIPILLILILALTGCASVKEAPAEGTPLWTEDLKSAEERGKHLAVGHAEDEDIYDRIENAFKDGKNELALWVSGGIDEITDGYIELSGSRVNADVVDALRERAPEYVPAWISGAEETEKYEENGELTILLELDMRRMRTEVRSFAELMLSKVVEQREARNNARSFLMPAIDRWFEGEGL